MPQPYFHLFFQHNYTMLKRALLLFLLIPALAGAQNINGYWKGTVVMAPGHCFPVYNIEMQIQAAGTKITGTVYHFSDSMNYVRENFEGTYQPDSNRMSIQEIGIVTFKIKEDCVPCVKKYNLTYHKGVGPEEQIRGSYTGKATDGKTACEPGTIILIRYDKPTFKPEVKLPPQLTNRKAELVKEIRVDTGVIKIDFYDNGQIDGDTISVFVNNMPSVSKKGLSAKPVSISIKIDHKRPEQEVIMVGENLGTIPPNTALMIINDGEKLYQLYLSSDEAKNAMVRFIYEDPLKLVNGK
jgi:hypothetical protein